MENPTFPLVAWTMVNRYHYSGIGHNFSVVLLIPSGCFRGFLWGNESPFSPGTGSHEFICAFNCVVS